MGDVINFPGVERSITTLDYERAKAVCDFKWNTDDKIMKAEIELLDASLELTLLPLPVILMVACAFALGAALFSGQWIILVVAPIAITTQVLCFILSYRGVRKKLKAAKDMCYRHVMDKKLYDDDGNLKRW